MHSALTLLLDLTALVQAYPVATAGVIGGLGTVTVSLAGTLGQRIWAKLGKMEEADDEFRKTAATAQLVNAQAHADILLRVEKGHTEMMGTILPRLVAVEVKVENVSQRLPNGELKEILREIEELKRRL